MNNGKTDLKKSDIIQSVVRAFQLLEIISQEKKIGVSELSRKSGLKKATVVRMLNTLKKINIIDQDPNTQMYFLGLFLYKMGNRAVEYIDVKAVLKPHIRSFVEKENLSALVGVYNKNEVVYIEKFDGNSLYQIRIGPGNTASLMLAAGKCFLSFLPAEQRSEAIKTAFRLRYNTQPTDMQFFSIEAELDAVRENGYAIDYEEHQPGTAAVGIPIFNHKGEVDCSVVFPMLISQIPVEGIIELAKRAGKLSAKISRKSGYNSLEAKPTKFCPNKNKERFRRNDTLQKQGFQS